MYYYFLCSSSLFCVLFVTIHYKLVKLYGVCSICKILLACVLEGLFGFI